MDVLAKKNPADYFRQWLTKIAILLAHLSADLVEDLQAATAQPLRPVGSDKLCRAHSQQTIHPQ
jgi:hypothetical protein